MKPKGKRHPLQRPKGQSKTYVHTLPLARPKLPAADPAHLVALGDRGWGTLQSLAAKLGMGESEAMEYLLGQVRVLRGG